jgi:hypothetical protein
LGVFDAIRKSAAVGIFKIKIKPWRIVGTVVA